MRSSMLAYNNERQESCRWMFSYGVSAGKRDQIEFFFKKKFLSKIDVDLIIWSRIFVISKKIFLSIWSLFPALTPYILNVFLVCQYLFSNFLVSFQFLIFL